MRLKRLALGVLALVALPLVANGFGALAELLLYGTLYRDGRPGALYPQQQGAPALLPGASVHGLALQTNINSYGLRGPEPREPKPATRIWVLGGSSSYDVHAPDDASTWPARLEAGLLGSGHDVEVLNGGRPGEVLMGSWDQLLEHRQALQPDVVILYHGPNDIRQAMKMQLGGAIELLCDQDVLPPVDIAMFRWRERVRSPGPIPEEWNARRLTRWQEIDEELRRVLDQSRNMGLQPVVVSHALWPGDEEGMLAYAGHIGMGPEGIEQAFDEYNERARHLAEARGVLFVDLAAGIPDDPEMWGDPSHFASPGSALAGQILAEALAEHGLAK